MALILTIGTPIQCLTIFFYKPLGINMYFSLFVFYSIFFVFLFWLIQRELGLREKYWIWGFLSVFYLKMFLLPICQIPSFLPEKQKLLVCIVSSVEMEYGLEVIRKKLESFLTFPIICCLKRDSKASSSLSADPV